MKVLTLTQPYATLIAIGAKRIETRSWATSYRGPLAIHAGKGLGPVGGVDGLRGLCLSEPFFSVLKANDIDLDWVDIDVLPRGAIIAVCDLINCFPTDSPEALYGNGWDGWPLTEQERAFGDYTPGRYGWLLANVRVLPEPIPAKGALSLWEWQPPEGFAL